MPSTLTRSFLLVASGIALGAALVLLVVSSDAAAPAVEERALPQRPWGRLLVSEVFLEPPQELLDREACAVTPGAWQFVGFDPASLRTALASTPLEPRTIEAIVRGSDCGTDGCRYQPSVEMVQSLSAEARGALYALLGRWIEYNPLPAEPFKQLERHRSLWQHDTGLAPALAGAFERLLYGGDGMVRFADPAVLCQLADDATQRRRLMKTLGRRVSLLVKVQVAPQEDVTPLVEWWGRGKSRRNLEPLLESLSRSPTGGTIDIVHLLPRFARERLYSYPEAHEAELNCFWSALNMLEVHPELERYQVERASETLAREYEPAAPEELRMGDVVAFFSPDARLIHMSAYVADDIVFTKNGQNVYRPWVLMRLDEVAKLYPEGPTLQGFRRRAVPAPL